MSTHEQAQPASAQAQFESEGQESGGMSLAPPPFQLAASPADPNGPGNGRGPIQMQEDKGKNKKGSTAKKKVFLIGSPSPKELKHHPYQFVNAAKYQGTDKNTIWMVEKTGYELGKVKLSTIESAVGKGKIVWITPSNTPVKALNAMPDKSIESLVVMSHGLPGVVTLRYGWAEKHKKPNYGLNIAEVSGLKGTKFTANPKIVLNSCNSGSDTDNGSLTGAMAQQTGKNVTGWTGRTSYREVNDGNADGDTEIKPSDMSKGGSRLSLGYDMTEVFSQVVKGRVPRKATEKGSGGFDSTIEIVSRLPETRHFHVKGGKSVSISFSNAMFVRPFRGIRAKDIIRATLYKTEDNGIDDKIGSRKINPVKGKSGVWTKLKQGTYWFEIVVESGPVSPYETFSADVDVDVK